MSTLSTFSSIATVIQTYGLCLVCLGPLLQIGSPSNYHHLQHSHPRLCSPRQSCFSAKWWREVVVSRMWLLSAHSYRAFVLSETTMLLYKPNLCTFNTIKDKLVVEAFNLVTEMITRGIAPDVVTYNSLIYGVCKLGMWSEAMRLWNKMVSRGIFPDIITFNILVDAHCKAGMVVEAINVVRMMIKRGNKPNTVTYNSLMNGYCLRGEIDEAKQVFDLIVSKGSLVGVDCFNTLINGYCKQKKIDEANKVFQEVPFRGIVPDTITYKTLMDSFYKSGRIEEADKLFSEMQGGGLIPDVHTYGIILDGLCNSQKLSTAVQLLREVEGNNLKLNIILKALFKAAKSDSAVDVFLGMSIKGVQPNVQTYNRIIQGFCEAGLLSEAEKLLRDMRERLLSKCWTFNIVIRGFINKKEILRAKGLIHEMVECGFSADACTMKLIAGLLSEAVVDPALLVLLKDS